AQQRLDPRDLSRSEIDLRLIMKEKVSRDRRLPQVRLELELPSERAHELRQEDLHRRPAALAARLHRGVRPIDELVEADVALRGRRADADRRDDAPAVDLERPCEEMVERRIERVDRSEEHTSEL